MKIAKWRGGRGKRKKAALSNLSKLVIEEIAGYLPIEEPTSRGAPNSEERAVSRNLQWIYSLTEPKTTNTPRSHIILLT